MLAKVKPFKRAIQAFSFLTPRREDMWVFGAWDGETFSDNSKYLFLHCTKEELDIRPIWISKNREIVEDLRKAGYESYYAFSWRGYFYSLYAGTTVVCNTLLDVNQWAVGRSRVIQLWHGFPLKKIEWDMPSRQNLSFKEALLINIRDKMYRRFDWFVSPNVEVKDVLADAFNQRSSKILPLGMPRNDIFYSEFKDSIIGVENEDREHLKIVEETNNRVISYLPTFRDNFNVLEKMEPDFEKIDTLLEKEEALLLVKTHYHEDFRDEEHENIIFLNRVTDVYPFLKYSDVLITDYSSVFYDFLHTDGKQVLLPFDKQTYEQERGFYFDYESIMPGPQADSLLESVKRGLSDESGEESGLSLQKPGTCKRIMNEFAE